MKSGLAAKKEKSLP